LRERRKTVGAQRRRWKDLVTTDDRSIVHTMEARPRLLLVVVAIFVSISAVAAAVINVKNYGAHGNGVNDDTKVLSWSWI
jgi:hypothetical protein